MPPHERLWLDDEKGLLPEACHPGQKHQEHPIRCGTGRSFHLSVQDDQRFSQERMFCDQFGLVTGLVDEHPRNERGGVGFGPGDEAVVERLKTQAYQPRDEGANPVHGRRYPYVRMSESMLAIVLCLLGIGKQ